MRIVFCTALLVAVSVSATGQSAATQPTFEVASIKVAQAASDGRFFIRMNSDAGRINYTNASLRDLLRAAYKVRDHQIEGPDWLGSQRFDVTAKFPEGAKR